MKSSSNFKIILQNGKSWSPASGVGEHSAAGPKCFQVSIPNYWTLAHLRDIIALSSGVCADLGDKLKFELQTDDDSVLMRSNPRGFGRQKKSKNFTKGKMPKSGFSIPLHNDTTLISTLSADLDNMTVINVSNWNKIGSLNKLHIVVLLKEILSSDSDNEDHALVKEIYDSLMLFKEQYEIFPGKESVSKIEVLAAFQENCISSRAVSLLDLLGFSKEDETGYLKIDSKSAIKNRRMQLFSEYICEFQSKESALRTLDYGLCYFPQPQNFSSSSIRNELASSPMSIESPRTHHYSRHTCSRSLPNLDELKSYEPPTEESVFTLSHNSLGSRLDRISSSARSSPRTDPSSSQISDIEYDDDFLDDDFSLSAQNFSGSPRGNQRRRDRRRRRRERARLLLSEYQSFAGDDQLTYDQLFELENIPVGLSPEAIRRLPVQTLCKKDIDFFSKAHSEEGSSCADHTCRICLSEYCVGDSILRLPCMHFYHRSCIIKWLSSNKKCPQDMIPVEI